jgi:hypothetical protein
MTADLDRVPVRECGEPLVAVPWALLLEPGRPVLLRAGLVQRLADAARLLESPGRLAVVEGYRPSSPQDTGGAVVVTLADAAADERSGLDEALRARGLVAHPGRKRLWSHGDRYWALATGVDDARYGPVGAVGEPVPALVALGAG